MGDTAFVILFALLFVFSVYIGFTIGERWGERAVDARAYWLYNLAAILVCVVLTAVLTLLPLLYATPLGLLMGSIVGLKMGFGESVGPWRLLDRFFNRNRGQRGVDAARKAEVRRRRRAGEREPDLISVAPGQGGSTPAQHTSGAGRKQNDNGTGVRRGRRAGRK